MSTRRSAGPDKASEIIASAARLFRDKGVKAVSVDEIVQGAGVAKGTFYLYFKTKDDLLEKLSNALVEQIALAAEAAGAVEAGAIDRFAAAVLAMQGAGRSQHHLVEALNHPENSALHELANVALVRRVAPVLAAIVEQGRREGAFDVEDAEATIEFLLAGQAALLGGGRFDWSPDDHVRRLQATLIVIERALGAPAGAIAARFATLGMAPADVS
ncbi:TetR/AcrR family transcriptional regulator [Bosea sp. TWI1241]|uniref:TetR/AcrR family transcriptional regulator n=1 Tax=Bosea sp. TWI1241 TaxID=3148904 RepID=UPI0032093E3B